jgi:hypothetical protein
MVKAAKTQKRKSRAGKQGRGQPPRGDAARTDRLIMRVHPDLLPLLDEKAREKGQSRSQFVEQLLIGWLRIDPRTPRITAFGQLDLTPAPADGKKNPYAFLSRWEKFCTASRLVLGFDPPDEWMYDWAPDVSVDPNERQDPDERVAIERWSRRPR